MDHDLACPGEVGLFLGIYVFLHFPVSLRKGENISGEVSLGKGIVAPVLWPWPCDLWGLLVLALCSPVHWYPWSNPVTLGTAVSFLAVRDLLCGVKETIKHFADLAVS